MRTILRALLAVCVIGVSLTPITANAANAPVIRKPVHTPSNGHTIDAPSVQEAVVALRRIQRAERADGECCTTMAIIQKCEHFDIGIRNYPTCVDWVWNSINNRWRPGYHWVDRPLASCNVFRLDADFKIGSGGGTLVQRKGIQAPTSSGTDSLIFGFSTAEYLDSSNPRVQSKLTTASGLESTCSSVAHQAIYN